MKRTLFLLAFLTAFMLNAQSPFPSGIRLPNATKSDTISDNTRIPIMQHNSGNLINKYVPVSDIVGSLSGFVPTTRTITINGFEQDLSANRTWNVGDVLTSGSYSNPSWITSLAYSKLTENPTTIAGYGITDFNSLGDARWVLSSGSYGNPSFITSLAYSKITGVPDFLRADVADQKTSGDLLFYDDVEAEFGNTNPMGISGNNTINTIRLASKDLQITDNVTQRFLFSRSTGNFTNTGNITSSGTGNNSFEGTLSIGSGATVSSSLRVSKTVSSGFLTSLEALEGDASSNNIIASISDSATSGFIFRSRQTEDGSWAGASALELFNIRYNGNTSIGNINNTYKLDVSGTGRFTSTVTATDFILSSDRRLKKKIKDYKVVPIKLNLKNYVLKSDESNKETIGVIAQQLERNHPEFVETSSEGLKGVNYIKLILAKVAELEQRIEELENR